MKQCTLPIFLTALYLDDGSLTISYSHSKKKNIVYCHPSIILYTLNFTTAENTILASHFNYTFGTNFVVSKHPDGHKSLLKLNKEKEVRHLLKIIEPYVKQIPSMAYKMSIEENIKLKKNHILEKFNKGGNILVSSSNRNRPYKEEEIERMIRLKNDGKTDLEIANQLGKTYWSIVYKLADLRKQKLL